MRWLKRDDGVSVVLVGILLAVLLALSGMAVDLGAVFAERRELRNGADAAALAIAEDCGRRTRSCDEGTASATAQSYADANSHDAASAVESVELVRSSATTGEVRVVTGAWDAAAEQAGVRVPLLSLLGFHRVEVGAAATAIFDHPATGEGLPLIIDTCEFDKAGGYGSGSLVTLYFHSPSATDPPPEACPANPAHWDFPGGFGWLDPNNGVCDVALSAGDWVHADEGNNVPRNCDPAWLAAYILDQTILIPMYVDLDAHDKLYAVAGFSAFHVTAYKLSSGNQYTRPAGFRCPLNPADTCLQGYFTTTTVFTGQAGGDDYGVVLVKLTE
jgi:Flp pilus assembly protein TadG